MGWQCTQCKYEVLPPCSNFWKLPPVSSQCSLHYTEGLFTVDFLNFVRGMRLKLHDPSSSSYRGHRLPRSFRGHLKHYSPLFLIFIQFLLIFFFSILIFYLVPLSCSFINYFSFISILVKGANHFPLMHLNLNFPGFILKSEYFIISPEKRCTRLLFVLLQLCKTY